MSSRSNHGTVIISPFLQYDVPLDPLIRKKQCLELTEANARSIGEILSETLLRPFEKESYGSLKGVDSHCVAMLARGDHIAGSKR